MTPRCSSSRAEEEVGDDVEVVAEREVLVDGRDAESLGVVRPVDADRLALPLDGALVDGVHAGDRLDQRGLSGAVVADQGDHFSGVDFQFDVGERLHGTEPLGDSAQRQHGRSGHVNHLLRRLTGGDTALAVRRGGMCREHCRTGRTCARPVPVGNGCVRGFCPAPAPQRGRWRARGRLCRAAGRVRRDRVRSGAYLRPAVLQAVADSAVQISRDRVRPSLTTVSLMLSMVTTSGQQLGRDALVAGAAGRPRVGEGVDVLALEQVDRDLGGVVGLAA